uniref:Uncharacterized protein n=1 Tax=viral metagenome TaxID=1070528 RepID=A0A6C0EBI3_9ZZZZ
MATEHDITLDALERECIELKNNIYTCEKNKYKYEVKLRQNRLKHDKITIESLRYPLSLWSKDIFLPPLERDQKRLRLPKKCVIVLINKYDEPFKLNDKDQTLFNALQLTGKVEIMNYNVVTRLTNHRCKQNYFSDDDFDDLLKIYDLDYAENYVIENSTKRHRFDKFASDYDMEIDGKGYQLFFQYDPQYVVHGVATRVYQDEEHERIYDPDEGDSYFISTPVVRGIVTAFVYGAQ